MVMVFVTSYGASIHDSLLLLCKIAETEIPCCSLLKCEFHAHIKHNEPTQCTTNKVQLVLKSFKKQYKTTKNCDNKFKNYKCFPCDFKLA